MSIGDGWTAGSRIRIGPSKAQRNGDHEQLRRVQQRDS